jgi:5-(carboxyamino)imidazole ribonucleotide mutase
MSEVLILLGSSSDMPIVAAGLDFLKKLEISYEMRIASAHRAHNFLKELVVDFDNNGGKVFICVAGKSAHLGGVVASLTQKPVVCVPVFNQEVSGFDSLLSMVQMPKGVPVATMGFGKSGFLNGCILSTQMLALSSDKIKIKLMSFRNEIEGKVISDDSKYKEVFTV